MKIGLINLSQVVLKVGFNENYVMLGQIQIGSPKGMIEKMLTWLITRFENPIRNQR